MLSRRLSKSNASRKLDKNSNLIAMASKLMVMASNLVAMASNLMR